MKIVGFRERFLQRAGRAEVTLSGRTVDQIETYYLLLNHWNRKINLTALALEGLSDQVIDRVLVEPLVAAQAVPPSRLEWFDFGSGGGSPAFPIKISRPLSRLTLVEARTRKAAFLREVVRELALSDVVVVDDRFENLASRSDLEGTADLVTVRAVRIDAQLFESAHRLLKPYAELFLFSTRGIARPLADHFHPSRTLDLIPAGESELVVFTALDVPRGTFG